MLLPQLLSFLPSRHSVFPRFSRWWTTVLQRAALAERPGFHVRISLVIMQSLPWWFLGHSSLRKWISPHPCQHWSFAPPVDVKCYLVAFICISLITSMVLSSFVYWPWGFLLTIFHWLLSATFSLFLRHFLCYSCFFASSIRILSPSKSFLNTAGISRSHLVCPSGIGAWMGWEVILCYFSLWW